MLVNRACAFLSRKFPAHIVCCSEASLRIHKKLSYDAEKLEVSSPKPPDHGFDLEQVKPDPTARVSVREELGIPADALLIGIAARFHPKGSSQLRSGSRAATQTNARRSLLALRP